MTLPQLFAVAAGVGLFGIGCFWFGEARLRWRRYQINQIKQEQIHEQWGGLL